MSPTPKNIIITGAGGFIGPLLAARLLNDPDYRLILTDLVEPVVPAGVKYPQNATIMTGDICDPAFVSSLLEAAKPLSAIFIFHGIMSAGSEANWDLSLRVNVNSVRDLLVALKTTYPGVRVIYSSSQAVYGQPLPSGAISDSVTPTPEGTYGAHKLLTEAFVNDMHRRGFIDAFSLRFPTVSVRPGRPTNAASSFLSGMIREPMAGEKCVVPLRDRSFRSFLCSPGILQENLVRVLGMESEKLPRHIRHINMPGISASIQELRDALARYGGEERLGYLVEEDDLELERILRSWAPELDTTTPIRLGLVKDESADALVKQYVDSLKR
ncbi:NAD(P)-binding protein [Annulohypoxylon maeteangense]|uniref:NAD(P)-binding protein n=1 Tax=Annulohypoxylon maeteangense TaxID=1927788 RepID=UPI002008C900|nr:NAD(P)-binding protein [Annulohypoxylon maeteangense]KAI0889075.1 NAD(P)-binding protein [Annulohypoxylon maeteangense]